MRVIPESELEKSKITLKATAGLRLISNEIANKILNKVEYFMSFYGRLILIYFCWSYYIAEFGPKVEINNSHIF